MKLKWGQYGSPEYIAAKREYDKRRRLDPVVEARQEANRQRWRSKNVAKMSAYQKEWALLKRYGITLRDRDVMMKKQGGLCAICKRPPPRGKTLHVDHDHATNKLRGLLCLNCNVVIGLLRDDHYTARRLTRYIREGGFLCA